MRSGVRFPVVLLLLLTSCEPGPGGSSAGVARDSAGVRVIDLPAPGPDDRVLSLATDPSWNPSAGLEIGLLLDVDLVPGRGVLLLDELAEGVSLLSDSGELLAVIGGNGEGPGEFNPQGLSRIVATDSSVYVPDLFLQRLTEFDLDGDVLGMQPFPLSPVYAVDWQRHPDGSLAFRAFEQFGDRIIRMRGETADTVLSLGFSNDHTNLLLSPVTLWGLTGEGNVAVARTDRAVVELRRGETGELVWQARWEDSEADVTEADIEHLEGLVRESILRQTPNISGETLAGNLASIRYPEKAPELAALLVSPEGEVWVRLAQPVREMGAECLHVANADAYGGPRWDVISPDGFLKARVRLPDHFTPRRFYDGWIYGIESDELGIQRVARVRAKF